eukprot:gene5036-5085_t
MLTKKELKEYCDDARQNYLAHISIDCVVFGFHEGMLKVLILEVKDEGEWYLPGGFLFKNEPIEMAANRILAERTGMNEVFLQQFHVFGDPERSKQHFEMYKDVVTPEENWFANRDLNDLPELKLDHALILKTALDALRLQLHYQPIGYNLMRKEFTMPELQKLYETILDKKLDRRNFQRRMLAFGILKRSEQLRKGGAHKAPYLYSFDLANYEAALKEGFKGGW